MCNFGFKIWLDLHFYDVTCVSSGCFFGGVTVEKAFTCVFIVENSLLTTKMIQCEECICTAPCMKVEIHNELSLP